MKEDKERKQKGQKEEEQITFHRYESDMTRKEKRELEKQKLGSMDWRGKLQYVWAYYKPAMAAVVGIILAIVFIWQTVENAKYKTVLNVSVIGASVGEQAEEIQEELQEQFGTENKYDKVTFDTSFMMQDVETADYNIMMKLTTVVAARELDVLITNQAFYDHYEGEGMFLDLSTLFTPEECETYEITEGTDRIEISDTVWFEKHSWVPYEPVYLTAISNTRHPEKIKEFIITVKEEKE